jgi:ferredoxin
MSASIRVAPSAAASQRACDVRSGAREVIEANMRLVVDYNKCRKAAQCSYLHPELFKPDESGSPMVLVEHPGEELREAAEEAAELCPNGAIALIEEDS